MNKMELRKLFDMQKKLDERIVREKGLKNQDLLLMRIMALQVELGELANEWRGFTFCSINQAPRVREDCFGCDGNGFDDSNEPCSDCGGTGWEIDFMNSAGGKIIFKNPLLEEYVDCLHFYLSIGNELGVSINNNFPPSGGNDVMTLFAIIFRYASEMWWDYYDKKENINTKWLWLFGFRRFLRLGEVFGFTWEEIERAYINKNVTNFKRQEEGY